MQFHRRVLATCLALLPLASWASDWPNRPITIVVPAAAGGTTDIAARVDLKADRRSRTLLVLGAFCEPGHDRGVVADRLAADLRTFAGWLDLDDVSVGTKGDLARDLRVVMGC